MSSFYDDASLVVIPSGYKTSKVYAEKPTDGSGDLAFTRTGDTATRVNSAGIIEKVRTNYARQSQSFATAAVWTATNGTITNNAGTAPDGTNTASKIVATNTDPFCYQSITLTGPVVASCYVKAVGSAIGKSAEIRAGVSLTSFTLSGSWQRVSVTHTASGAHNYGLEVPNPGVIGDEVLLWGFQVEGGDVVTDYIPTTTAAVSVGPVANVPRLDYLGSTCPRLLLEPQRTNLNIYSEDFTNATWDKLDLVTTNYANVVVSPDGFTNADKLIPNTTSAQYHGVQLSSGRPSLTGGTVYTYSIFAKAQGYDKIRIQNFSDGVRAQFNLTTGALINQNGTTSTFITPYGNGWYRIGFTYTQSTTQTSYWNVLVVSTDDNSGSAPVAFAGNGTDAIAVWGSTIEAGAYATSYIPTLGSASTRGSDACSKTGISSLIGQTEGTLFAEFNVPSIASAGTYTSLNISDGTSNNIIDFAYYPTGRIQAAVLVGGSITVNIDLPSYGLTAGTHKVAFAYKLNDYVLYVDGVQRGSDTSSAVPATSQIDLFASLNGTQVYNQALLFKTRLTNAQLAELTTL